jgi:hypothetical protein
MRFTFVILLFCCLGSDAQMIIKAHANYRPLFQFSGLLDDYSGAAAAYSLRKLDKDYTGSCIRIRRDNDNAEIDIGFVNNYVDTTAIKNFTPLANQSFVVTWYDQSGNNRNASQSVAGNQPLLITFNNQFGTIDAIASSEKAIVFVNPMRLINNFSTISQPISVFTYARKDNTTTEDGIVYDSYNNTPFALYYTGTVESPNNRWLISSGTGLNGTTAGTTNPSIFSTLHNSTSSSIHINGQSYASGNAGTNGLNGLSIGNLRGNPSPIASGYELNGRIAEMIIYGSNQSSNRTGIENNINDYYNIYWNGDFAGLLDSFPSSAAAYSLRNLDKDYLGPLVRVRRSNDNAEQDIFGDYYGNLDTVGLKNFVGANSGFVTTWYDQSGNGRNASQTTAANQPRVVNAGTVDRRSGDISLVYDGSNDFLEAASTSGLTISPTSFYAVSSRGNDADALRVVLSTGILADVRGYGAYYTINLAPTDTRNNLINQVRFQTGSQISSVGNYANTINTNSLLFSTITNTSNNTWFNGGNNVSETYNYTDNNTSRNIMIGARRSEPSNIVGLYLNGTTSEIVIWGANQSSNRTGIETNINSYYGIY